MNWTAVHKKLWVVVLVPLVAASIAFALTYEKAGQYRSVATVEASIPEKPTKTQTLKDIENPNQYYENMVGTMKTELITSMVSYRLLLHDLEKEIAFRPPAIQYTNDRKNRIKSTLEKKISSFELLSENVPVEETIAQIIHNSDYDIARWIRDGEMTIQRKEGTNEILVSTTTEDPFLSAFASNALSQEYIRYETTIFSPAPTNDSIGYYRQEVDRLRKDMDAKSSEISEVSARAKAPVTDIRFRREKANRISEYEMRIVEEEWELNSLRDELAKLQRPEAEERPRSSADVASNAKIQAARKKIDQLSALYADGGSKDKQLDSIITVLRKQVNGETARLQMASQNSSKPSTQSREKDILQGRIEKHEQNIASIRNDIRRLRNTNISGEKNNDAEIAQLKNSQAQANKDYNLALSHLKALEASEGISTSATSRANLYIVLKAKALPSAEPESPWAIFIIIGSFIGTLTVCILWVGAKKQAPQIPDDIFLKVNYANRQRRPVPDNQ
jgi:succinoglycan biosynthesis transport protein ExoP